MEYFLIKGDCFYGGDDMGTQTHNICYAIASPNKLGAIHMIAKLMFDLTFDKSIKQSIVWRDVFNPVNDDDSINEVKYYDSSIMFHSIDKVSQDEFITLKKYFDNCAYSYSELSMYGDYSNTFNEDIMIGNNLYNEMLYLDMIEYKINRYFKNSGIVALDYSNEINNDLTCSFIFNVQMHNDAFYNAKITTTFSNPEEVEYFKENKKLTIQSLSSTMKIKANAENNTSDKEDSSNLETIQKFITSISSETFKELSLAKIENTITGGTYA